MTTLKQHAKEQCDLVNANLRRVFQLPRTVAFLQNQWFKDPERMKVMYAKWIGRDPENAREKWIRTWLFYSCLTGRRLQKAFGNVSCNLIVWDEVSREIGGTSSSVFKPDLVHMQSVIEKHQPQIVLVFGDVAKRAYADLRNLAYKNNPVKHLIGGPHPAARGATVVPAIQSMANEWIDTLERISQ